MVDCNSGVFAPSLKLWHFPTTIMAHCRYNYGRLALPLAWLLRRLILLFTNPAERLVSNTELRISNHMLLGLKLTMPTSTTKNTCRILP